MFDVCGLFNITRQRARNCAHLVFASGWYLKEGKRTQNKAKAPREQKRSEGILSDSSAIYTPSAFIPSCRRYPHKHSQTEIPV
jgi:hypothetical protein